MKFSTLFVILAAALVLFLGYRCTYGSVESIDITVIDTYNKRKGEDDVYMVDAQDETFKNQDNLFFLKKNSSDLQRELKKRKGKQIRVQVVGWRVDWLSMHRNILKIESD